MWESRLMFHVEKQAFSRAGDPNGTRTRVFAVKQIFPLDFNAPSHKSAGKRAVQNQWLADHVGKFRAQPQG
jgi:hypothetical protein